MDKNKIPLYLVIIINGLNCILVIRLILSGEQGLDVAIAGTLFLFIASYYLLKGELVTYITLFVWYFLLLIEFEIQGWSFDFSFGLAYDVTLSFDESTFGFDAFSLIVILLLLYDFPGVKDKNPQPASIDLV